jgi:two-component system, OmpR family, response regulator MprA
MPGLDGPAVARRLRAKGSLVPILMLTARDAVPHRVQGLEAGADDYLVKPFETVELVARIRALLRRGQVVRVVSHGDLQVDPDALVAVRGGRRIDLTPREAELLALLVRSAGRVVSRGEALAEVWSDGPRPTENAVDQHITYLRAKLGKPPLIQTVRGVGFVVRR